ncbi:high mobility group protein B2b isoform X1 [Labrus mixtus]|uniref:high mobility group protein B2b isoform X1 n=1 Tax=Labrus mixtus TaxID=508554 RepID=UPI0029C0F695|nr:high mobility group protein B2b isoform X1 [Labrus mixtus]XP_060887314.1 high mobility group protein B2b isoform X1 [Labrus mixtus]
MLRCVFVCLLLGFISSAPLNSDGDSWSASSSDEDPQLPAVFPVVGGASQQAPLSMIMKVMDTKSNITLSFAIFILPEVREEGSGTDGGRSDDSSEESTSESIQPITSLFNSSEEMMSDQPMFTSDEGVDDFTNTLNGNDWNQIRTISDDFDDLSNTSIESKVNQKFRVLDESDEFNNGTESTESTEIHREPAEPIEPSEDTEMKQTLQGVTLNPANESASSSQQKFGTDMVDKLVLDPVSQEVTSSSSEITNSLDQDRVSSGRGSKDFRFGSSLQKVFRSMKEVVGRLSGYQGVMGRYHSVVGSTLNPVPVSQEGLSLSNEESLETGNFSREGSDSESPTSFSSESLRVITYSIQNSASLNPASQDQDVPSMILSGPNDTISQVPRDSAKSLTHKDVSLESQQSDGTKKVLGATRISLNGSQVGYSQSSSESVESLETVGFSGVRPDSENQTSVSSDSEESPEATYGIHTSTGSGYSTQRVTGSTSTSISDSIVSVPDSKKAQDTPVMSVQADEGASLSPASQDQDIAPTILNIPKDTISQVHIKGSTRFSSQMNVGLISDSSEESHKMDDAGKVLGSTSSGPGLYSAGSPEVSSRSEEVLLALPSSSSPPAVPSPQTSTETRKTREPEKPETRSRVCSSL